jgi:hypothetical protein
MKETGFVLLATVVPFGWLILGAVILWRLMRRGGNRERPIVFLRRAAARLLPVRLPDPTDALAWVGALPGGHYAFS